MNAINKDGLPFEAVIVVPNYEMLMKVYALLGGTSANAISGALAAPIAVSEKPSAPVPAAAEPSASAAEASPNAAKADEASGGVEIDAHGHPWSAEMHTGTKGKTKEDLWRMKPGVSRPDPLPGYPKDDSAGNGGTGTKSDGPAPDAGAAASGASAGTADEDDEFAAFREAAAAGNDKGDVPARSWTDADLSSLANQAAQALGGPDKVKALIAKFVPEGEIARSSNIPADKREEFAVELEAEAGIEFAG